MKNLVLAVLISFGAVSAHAGAYGTAGCGLGSMVFGNQPGFIQIVAMTLNGFAGSQLFGITFGTSNCDSGSATKADSGVKAYVEANRVALNTDAARGNGETLANLATVMNCDQSGAFAQSLQANYAQVFPESGSNSDQISEKLMELGRSNGCSI